MTNRTARRVVLAAVFTAGPFAGAAPAATIPVTPDSLPTAWASAQPGDRLQLSGDFPAFNPKAVPANLTIDAARATVTNWQLQNSSGLTWTGGTLKPQLNQTVKGPRYTSALAFKNASHLDVGGVSVQGPDDPTDGGSYGISITGGEQVHVHDSTFASLAHGLPVGAVDGFEIDHNTFTNMRVDGINIAQDWNGSVHDNHVMGSAPVSGAHPDAIQSWSRPDKPPTAKVKVYNNLIEGDTQGIFFGNHVRLEPAGYTLADGTVLSVPTQLDDGGFDNVEIYNNEIDVSAPDALGIAACRGGRVQDNLIRTQPGSSYRASLHVTDCTGLVQSGNVVEAGAGKLDASDADADPAMAGVLKPDPRDGEISDLRSQLAIADAKAADLADRLEAANEDLSFVNDELAASKAALAQIATLAAMEGQPQAALQQQP